MDRGQSLIVPPLFDGTNYAYWKVRMRAFLLSLDEKMWQVMEVGWTKPKEAPANWDDAKIKAANFKSRALNALFIAITNEEFKKISSTETAKETWTILQTTYEGTKAVESKFEKMDDQNDIHIAYAKLYKVFEKYEKLYRLATKKLSDVELEQEKLSTKFDKANQTIGALRFEKIFFVERTKTLMVELFQVRAQLERTLSAKLDEMLSMQKSASNQTGLGYDFSFPNIASSSTTVFVSPANNIESENNDAKIVIASENINKGLRKVMLKSLKRRSSIFIITVEQLDILVLIATSSKPLNRAIVWSHPEN
ncbi:hypothetical protein ACB092_04G061400 [Castanea dentata]